jgi:hypothetical protein
LKTEERTKNASAGDPPAPPVDRYVKPLSGARTGSPERVSDALQLIAPTGSPAGEISTESLILAQDERWRRA